MRFHSSASSGRKVSSLRSPVSVSFSQSRDLREPIHLVHALQHRLIVHLMHLLPAQKIVAPLHQRRFQLRREIFLQEGNVFLKELLLQRFRRGGNHHAPPAANRRNQIRQRFSRSRAGLDDRVLVPLESLLHHSRHRQLRRAKFVSRMPRLQQPARPENSSTVISSALFAGARASSGSSSSSSIGSNALSSSSGSIASITSTGSIASTFDFFAVPLFFGNVFSVPSAFSFSVFSFCLASLKF